MKIFRWNSRPDGDGLLAEVNMTPLIDVSLVLVIILLLATPLAFESHFTLGRTQTSDEDTGESGLSPEVRLQILSEAQVQVNDKAVAVADLPGAIGAALLATSQKIVAISCADDVSHGTFVQVLDIAKLSGAMGIAIVEPGAARRIQ